MLSASLEKRRRVPPSATWASRPSGSFKRPILKRTGGTPVPQMYSQPQTKALSPFSSVRIRTESSMVATKILPSPILPVLAAPRNSRDSGIGSAIRKHNLQFDFRQEIDSVFTAAIDFGVAFLPAKSFDFSHRHPFNADFTEGVLHFLQFERFDYRFNLLHVSVRFSRQRSSLPLTWIRRK